MATTTNYAWTTPDDTGLVKDGASAIRTLGSAIDTSLYTGLHGGQVMSGSQSVTVTATNGASTSFTVTFPRTFTSAPTVTFSSILVTNASTNCVLGYLSAAATTTSASALAMRVFGATTTGITLTWIATNAG